MLRRYEDEEYGEGDEEEMIHLENLENTAFLSARKTPQSESQHHSSRIHSGLLTEQIGGLFGFLEKFKFVILVAGSFIVALALLVQLNREDNTLPLKLPQKSTEQARQVAKELEGTIIPPYVLTYAPIVVLDRHETFFPSDLSVHLQNTHPTYNFTAIPNSPTNLSLSNLDQLNSFKDGSVYLSSNEPIISLPKWLRGQKPDKKSLHSEGTVSCIVVVVEKNSTGTDSKNIVDAFYLYFYSFNDGPKALGHQVGNHVGDWEHNMIRFSDGVPTAIWYSQHGFGAAYTYDAVQKIGVRPVSFSARGSHSNWPEAMAHDFHNLYFQIPSHLAYDYTSLGRLWDPTLSALYYSYSSLAASSEAPPTMANASLRLSTGTFMPALPSQPTEFLYYDGQWGDQQLLLEDEGQEEIHGFFKWTSGPKGVGWGDKAMVRDSVCPEIPDSYGESREKNEGTKIRDCIIKSFI